MAHVNPQQPWRPVKQVQRSNRQHGPCQSLCSNSMNTIMIIGSRTLPTSQNRLKWYLLKMNASNNLKKVEQDNNYESNTIHVQTAYFREYHHKAIGG